MAITFDEMNKFLGGLTGKKGGFFKLEELQPCTSPQHNPPSHLYIPSGKGYRHVCPHCHKETIIKPLQVSL